MFSCWVSEVVIRYLSYKTTITPPACTPSVGSIGCNVLLLPLFLYRSNAPKQCINPNPSFPLLCLYFIISNYYYYAIYHYLFNTATITPLYVSYTSLIATLYALCTSPVGSPVSSSCSCWSLLFTKAL